MIFQESRIVAPTSFTLFRVAFPRLLLFSYLDTMRKELSGCRSCLDVGCGGGSPARHLAFEHSMGVDGYAPALEAARRLQTHSDYRLAGATEIDVHFQENQFDCCVALDLIEHLSKDDGLKLIRDMDRIASQKILIFTPNGFLPQQGEDGELQDHRSAWSAPEMRALGFKVIGMLGPKFMRHERHRHRFKPSVLSGIISAILHVLFTGRHPEHAAALLCVKHTRSSVGGVPDSSGSSGRPRALEER